MKPSLFNRRHFLRAAGTIVALPALESIGFRRLPRLRRRPWRDRSAPSFLASAGA